MKRKLENVQMVSNKVLPVFDCNLFPPFHKCFSVQKKINFEIIFSSSIQHNEKIN